MDRYKKGKAVSGVKRKKREFGLSNRQRIM